MRHNVWGRILLNVLILAGELEIVRVNSKVQYCVVDERTRLYAAFVAIF
jgi:hypothetical protein